MGKITLTRERERELCNSNFYACVITYARAYANVINS